MKKINVKTNKGDNYTLVYDNGYLYVNHSQGQYVVSNQKQSYEQCINDFQMTLDITNTEIIEWNEIAA